MKTDDLIDLRDKACLSYWFPRIRDAGLQVPETIVIAAPLDISRLVWGERPEGFQEFIHRVREALMTIGLPAFLRTGHTSGKHQWRETCFVTDLEQVPHHIFNLVEFSEMVDMIGLPCQVFAVRKLIPTRPAFYAFNGMPIVREFRFFAGGNDGASSRFQPYWPPASINRPDAKDWYSRLKEISTLKPDEAVRLHAKSLTAALACGGEWSVDWLQDASGNWWLTDMAPAKLSYRWNQDSEA